MSADTWLIHAVPISIAVQPAIDIVALLVRWISHEVAVAAANAATVVGRNARPACSGVSPLTPLEVLAHEQVEAEQRPLSRNLAR